jgi:dienelactone hydrolase
VTLEGALAIPPGANGVVVFAHGSGSSRHSPRNQFVARVIRESGNGTLLFDLLTAEEEIEDNVTRSLRFDSGLLASRLAEVTSWLVAQPATRDLGIGYFGSSTGGGAALAAAAEVRQRMPWSRAADGPISRVMRCRACSRRRWASWAETMTR